MVATAPRLRDDVDEILPGVIADRRHFHENPELGFQEVETGRVVAERLRSLGLEDVRTGIAKTGVTGLIRGGKGDGKVVLLRADMDALPIEEENEVDYKSRNAGVMHACGHDAHTAMLLGIARILNDRKAEFAGAVKVLFQPAEEGLGGAGVMISEGVLEDPHVDAAFGMHMSPWTPVGTIAVRPGPAMAAADGFEIVIKARGGHGASPHLCVDPIAVGAQIITALQTIVAREIDPIQPAVVTVGSLQAGQAMNVIPDTATLRGTTRCFDPGVRHQLADRITELVAGIATAMRAEAEVNYTFGCPPLINDPAMTELVREAAAEAVGDQGVLTMPPIMPAEDFGLFLEQRPGCFYFVGCRNEARGVVWGVHHPRFDLDEESMAAGIETMTRTVLHYLER